MLRILTVSCVTKYPKVENTTVVYDGWDGKYPAPPGARVIYTCPRPLVFADGSPSHNATCSFQGNDTWETSFHGMDVRCRGMLLHEIQLFQIFLRWFENIMLFTGIHQKSVFDAIASVSEKYIISIVCLKTLALDQGNILLHEIVKRFSTGEPRRCCEWTVTNIQKSKCRKLQEVTESCRFLVCSETRINF